jgi:hypothetical protein
MKTITENKKNKIRLSDKVQTYKRRMLVWDSPVEYVNNMYGCHPNEAKKEYFDVIYGEKKK